MISKNVPVNRPNTITDILRYYNDEGAEYSEVSKLADRLARMSDDDLHDEWDESVGQYLDEDALQVEWNKLQAGRQERDYEDAVTTGYNEHIPMSLAVDAINLAQQKSRSEFKQEMR